MTVKVEEKRKSFNYFIYFIAVSVNLYSFSAGFAWSWTSPVLPKLYSNSSDNPLQFPIDKSQESWIASLLALGAFFSPIFAGICSERFGRKRTLIFFSLFSVVSFALTGFANTVELFYVARFLMGIGSGCVFLLVPIYVAEVSENKNRGFLSVLMGVILTSGALAVMSVGAYTSIVVISLTGLLPLLIFLIVFGIWAPETPYYLVGAQRILDAEKSLMILRNKTSSQVQEELQLIKKSVESSMVGKANFMDIFNKKSIRKGLVLTEICMIAQQLSGIGAILNYMQPIFKATGSSIPSDISSIVVGATQVIFNIVTSQLVDRLGRKFLMLLSCAGSCLAHISLGTYFFLRSNGNDVSAIYWLPTASLVSFVIFYNLALSCLPWTIMSELFPSRIKSLASTISCCTCLFLSFATSMVYPYLTEFIGVGPSFWLFAAFLALTGTSLGIFLPETKGKSFDEIQAILGDKSCAEEKSDPIANNLELI